MAHFAQLDENNVVINVIVVSNFDCLDENGNESEQVGINFCKKLLGGNWLQTSYNNSIRGRFAGIGYTYLEDADVFVAPQPSENYYLDTDYNWIEKG